MQPRFYPQPKGVELISKKEFAKTALDGNVEALVMHLISLSLSSISIYPAKEAQIGFLTKKVQIPAKYSDFSDVFFKKKASVLPEITDLNQYAIELQEANGFIRPLKLPAGALIFFVQKPDNKLRLYVDYQGLLDPTWSEPKSTAALPPMLRTSHLTGLSENLILQQLRSKIISLIVWMINRIELSKVLSALHLGL